jgi:CO dehydrogenase nickel-insertion accessory protein CooC1
MVIHGLGGIGKSTLAARFLERNPAEGVRVFVVATGSALAPATLAVQACGGGRAPCVSQAHRWTA